MHVHNYCIILYSYFNLRRLVIVSIAAEMATAPLVPISLYPRLQIEDANIVNPYTNKELALYSHEV